MTSISAFTNGLMLSKEKFIDELSSAGLTALSVSFHYDNALDYEKYARRNRENFYKILRGLEMVKKFNNQNPDRKITISTETMLFSGNQDKLDNIIKLISSTLENQINYIGFKRIQRFNYKGELYLLDDLKKRKKELADILKKYKYNFYFTRIPLCIIPDFEHLSTDLHYYLKSSKVIANFTDKNQMDSMHNLIKDLLDDPFKSFCIKCNLLGLCPMGSSSYENKAFFPYESQKPFPSKKDVKQIIKNIAQDQSDEVEMFKNYLKVNQRLKEEYKKALSCP
jgi:MoaA/NifB/PqqE/SkfB family radical SAM enzyme